MLQERRVDSHAAEVMLCFQQSAWQAIGLGKMLVTLQCDVSVAQLPIATNNMNIASNPAGFCAAVRLKCDWQRDDCVLGSKVSTATMQISIAASPTVVCSSKQLRCGQHMHSAVCCGASRTATLQMSVEEHTTGVSVSEQLQRGWHAYSTAPSTFPSNAMQTEISVRFSPHGR